MPYSRACGGSAPKGFSRWPHSSITTVRTPQLFRPRQPPVPSTRHCDARVHIVQHGGSVAHIMNKSMHVWNPCRFPRSQQGLPRH